MNPWHVPLPGLGFFLVTTFAAAQPATLELKNSVEQSLAPKDSPHEYVINTPGNQAFTLTVQQQGIDVVVSVVGPDGKFRVQLFPFDTTSNPGGEYKVVASTDAQLSDSGCTKSDLLIERTLVASLSNPVAL